MVHDNSGTPQTYASYTYDNIGQLTYENTLNAAQKKYIKYDVTGKVIAVARDAAFTQKVVEYVYNALGERIIKRSYNASYVHVQNTFYVGGVIYTQPVPGSPTVQEYAIDGGAGRIGTFYRPSSIYAYEMSDHLGNVRAVVAKNAGNLEVRMYTDYYPYGMVIQSGGTSYRYQYQGQYAEKDAETDWNAFELRMYDSRIARWLSVDPKGEFHSPYLAMGNSPTGTTDPDGGSTNSTHTDKNGKVLAVYNDGNTGIYKHNIDASDYNGQKLSINDGKLMGYTREWDEFAVHDALGNTFEKPIAGAQIKFGQNMQEYVNSMKSWAQKNIDKNRGGLHGGADWLAENSKRFAPLDIKEIIGASTGYLMGDGFYYSGESIGNYLFGMNLSYAIPSAFPMTASDWWYKAMQKVGEYHIIHNKVPHSKLRGQFPYFGEIPYSGRNIARGFWGSQYNKKISQWNQLGVRSIY